MTIADVDETLQLLADVARDAATFDGDRVRRLRDDSSRLDRDRWRELGELGWLGITVPERLGGSGLTLEAVAIIARRLGYAGSPEPYVAGGVLAPAVLAAAEGPAVDRLLQEVMAGTAVVALAWQRPSGGLGAESVGAAATPDGEADVVSGDLRFVGLAGADAFIIAAQGPNGVSMHLVAPDAAGLTVSDERQADGTLSARLVLDRVRVSEADRIIDAERGAAILADATEMARVAVAAELVGITDRVLELLTEYLGQREQFGRPIGSMQALQHRVCDLWIQRELSRAALDAAVAVFAVGDASSSERATAASSAKSRASQAASLIVREALQLHGAIGFTDEYDLGLYLNRVLSLAPWLGTASAHRTRYAQLVAGSLDQGGSRAVGNPAVDRPPLAPEQIEDYGALSGEELRRVVRAELDANYPQHLRFPSRRLYWPELEDAVRRLARLGWLAPGWSREHGGMGLSPINQVVMSQELERFGVARYQDHGVTQVGPIIIQFGTDEQRARWLPGIVNATEIWCQGYSEPQAGSDLASLRTRARLDADEYVVDGQKIWTTMAHDSTHIYTLVRTDPDVKKQAGISFLLIALDSPGVTVRPTRDIAGHQELCEVFFDGVRVPVDQRIGPENGGWTIAKSLLGHERINLGNPKQPGYALEMVVEVARARGLLNDPVFSDGLAALQLDVAHLGDAYARYTRMLARGEQIGPDVSMLKIWATETVASIADLIIEAAGESGGLAGEAEISGGRFEVLAAFYKARPAMIYGGTNEIQRNILASAVLGLPRG